MASTQLPTLIWNGRCFEPCAGLPMSDRGVRYGMALFESFAVRDGRVEMAAAHLEQLAASCHALGWPVDERAYEAVPEAMLRAYGPGPVFARLYQSAGEGGPFDPVEKPRLVLFGEPRLAPVPKTVRIVTLEEESRNAFFAPGNTLFGGLKTANYWGNLQALQQARAMGGDEGLRLNSAGEVYSACMANVFVLLDGELVTPSRESGARQGTIRRWVQARRPVREARLRPSELRAATGCFLTSTWAGIMPASHLNSRPLATTVGDDLRREWEAALLK